MWEHSHINVNNLIHEEVGYWREYGFFSVLRRACDALNVEIGFGGLSCKSFCNVKSAIIGSEKWGSGWAIKSIYEQTGSPLKAIHNC